MTVGLILGVLIGAPAVGIVGIFVKEIGGFTLMGVGFWVGVFGALIGSFFSMRYCIRKNFNLRQ
jgi:hypothetical protein